MTQERDDSDRPLVRAAREGDRAAFSEIVRRHKTPLYQFVRRYIGDPDDAYDILQETFVAAWQGIRRFDVQQTLTPWLRTIALNKCRDHGRRHAIRRRLLTLFHAESHIESSWIVDSNPELESPDLARLRRLDQAIARLPRCYKEPLLLVLMTGLTHQQAGAQLGITAKAVEMRIRRAKDKLRMALASARDGTAP